jgi:hypothetical protein
MRKEIWKNTAGVNPAAVNFRAGNPLKKQKVRIFPDKRKCNCRKG